MSESDDKTLVAQILSSYLSNNTVAPADLPSVIENVKKAFAGGGGTGFNLGIGRRVQELGACCPGEKVGHTRSSYLSRLRWEIQVPEAAPANCPPDVAA